MKIYREQGGSAVLVVLLLVGAFGLIGGAYFLFSGGSRDLASSQDPEFLFKELQSKIEKVLNTPELVHYSIERNPNSFSCLYTVDGVCLGQGGLFVLYEDTQNSYSLSQLGTKKGLTYEGLICDSYPSAQCPFRVEAEWSPVCSLGRCENTRSVKVRVKLFYHASEKPKEWSREEIYAPELKLSASVSCVRGGGVWAETQCLSPQEAQSRQIASSATREAQGIEQNDSRDDRRNEEMSQMQSVHVCPESIVIQGEYYGIEYTADNRGRIRVPAMNGCPAEDIFDFQCVAKVPANFQGEGHWVQVGASMAPTCDGSGRPLDESIRM
ncbi:MAG: hypothetical protein M9962_15690 [Oligoflexia bacterium]|nr:hypothetical protein [Oligoflexia bacterium]